MTLARFTNPWAWVARGPEDKNYEAAKDPAFLVECERELQRWRDWRDGKVVITGPPPQPAKVMQTSFLLPEDEDEPLA